MTRFIDADKVKEFIKNYGHGAISDGLKTLDPVDDIVALAKGVDLIPAADAAEVKHGKFVKPTPLSEAECDQCGKSPKLLFGTLPNYCPNCGAKMDGKQQKGDTE